MGRKQFETIVASVPREIMVNTAQSFTGVNVPSGGNVVFDLYAPAGTVGELVKMSVNIAAPIDKGAASGVHQLVLSTSGPSGSTASAIYNHDKIAAFNRNIFMNASSVEPNDLSALGMALSKLRFDSAVALRLFYFNSTNIALNGITIDWNVTWLKRDSA